MTDPDRVVFETPMVTVGAFRCPVDHPSFEDSGPAKHYCFVFPRNACWIAHEGERPFVADASVVPLYNPGRPYRRAAIDPAGDATDWFGVNPAILREMIAEFAPETAASSDQLFTLGAVDATANLFMTQRRVFNHVQASGPLSDALFVEEAVVDVLSDVLQRAYATGTPQPGTESHASLAARARAHLGRTFLARETVRDLADAIGVSPFHLCRVFRRETGHSLHRYRTELRLRWSLQPLGDGVDILSVALAAGFAHHSHFTNEFRRTFGVRPSEFRSGASSPRRSI